MKSLEASKLRKYKILPSGVSCDPVTHQLSSEECRATSVAKKHTSCK